MSEKIWWGPYGYTNLPPPPRMDVLSIETIRRFAEWLKLSERKPIHGQYWIIDVQAIIGLFGHN